jgi:hypothetical protein
MWNCRSTALAWERFTYYAPFLGSGTKRARHSSAPITSQGSLRLGPDMWRHHNPGATEWTWCSKLKGGARERIPARSCVCDAEPPPANQMMPVLARGARGGPIGSFDGDSGSGVTLCTAVPAQFTRIYRNPCSTESMRKSSFTMSNVFEFGSLSASDLIIDAVYQGGTKGNTGDDPLGRLIPGAGNQGGFRSVGSWDAPRLVVLYSSIDDSDWPDDIDVYTGVFTYFGDNKKPGFALHDTPRRGNRMLQGCFSLLHSAPPERSKIPPFLIFTKGSKGRDVVFRGLAVPGVDGDASEDLVAIWRSKSGERFQNYRAGSLCSTRASSRANGLTP